MILRHQHVRRLFSTNDASRFDLIVIGGGSGGLACSKKASDLGAKVALVDAVKPTPSGASWGIGGTCANVGCIPKKLMHQAAIVGKELKFAEKYGWEGVPSNVTHNWHTLVKVVDDRIKANNWIYRVQLNEKGIKYYNGFAEFLDNRTVLTTGVDPKKKTNILTAPNIVISTGLRPRYPKIKGAEHGITSDDLFSLKTVPGKTLVVGGGYVALECAGLLSDLQNEVDLLIRSRPLKTFDKDCAKIVISNLEKHGVNTRWGYEVEKVEICEETKQKKVFFTNNGEVANYDTVIWAMGRDPNLELLQLEKVKVRVSARNSRVLADEFDRTSVNGIYAIGDVVRNRAELTPLAIQAGNLLASRLFGNSKEIVEYEKTPTTVFTPLELSTVGLTEEDALRLYDKKEIEIYHAYFTPFEFVIPQDSDSENCYLKLICMRNKPQNILGMHFVGPNAAEVMQGFAVAFKKGITFDDLKSTIAIHPCSAEEFVKITITKRSGLNPKVAGCCG